MFFKKKVVRDIPNACWPHLVNVHKVSVDRLYHVFRCVVRDGTHDDQPVTFVRIFKPDEATEKGIVVTGWETFDQHPELIYFEGYYLKGSDQAFLECKRPQVPVL